MSKLYNAPRSKVLQLTVALREIKQEENRQDTYESRLDVLEKKIVKSIQLAEEVAKEVGPMGPIVNEIIGNLKDGIFSTQNAIRASSDAVTDDPCRKDQLPYFLLYEKIKDEREDLLHQKTRIQEMHDDTLIRNQQMTRNAFEIKEKMEQKNKEIREAKDTIKDKESAYRRIYEEKNVQKKEMTHASLTLHRELKAMGAMVQKYRSDIRDLHALRQRSENLRRNFEELERKRRIKSKWKKALVTTRVNRLLSLTHKFASAESSAKNLPGTPENGCFSDDDHSEEDHEGEAEDEKPVPVAAQKVSRPSTTTIPEIAESISPLKRKSVDYVNEFHGNQAKTIGSIVDPSYNSYLDIQTKLHILEIEQATQLEQQLLLLRNTRIMEYESSIADCSPDARAEKEKVFVVDYSMITQELKLLDMHIRISLLETIRGFDDNFLDLPSMDAGSIPVDVTTKAFAEFCFMKHRDHGVAALAELAKSQILPAVPQTSTWEPYLLRCQHAQKLPRKFSLEELIQSIDEFWCRVADDERTIDRGLSNKRGRNQSPAVRPIGEHLFSHLIKKYGDKDAALNVAYTIFTAVAVYSGESAQIQLFASALSKKVEQSAWRYFYRAKTCIISSRLSLDTPQEMYQAFATLYPRSKDTLVMDKLVTSVGMYVKGSMTTRKFFDWIAWSIESREEIRIHEVEQILRRLDSKLARALTLPEFIDAVLSVVSVPRGVIASYFKNAGVQSGIEDTSMVPIDRLMYIMAYLEIKDLLSDVKVTLSNTLGKGTG